MGTERVQSSNCTMVCGVLSKKILGINVNDIIGIQPRSISRRKKKNIKKHYQWNLNYEYVTDGEIW